MAYTNIEDQRAATRAHYHANKAIYLARARAHEAKNRPIISAWILAYLQEHPCIDCGEGDPIVLEFDHRDGAQKLFNVADWRNGRKTMRAVQDEIAKCDVRCANCHRRMTYKRAGRTHRGSVI